jgi:hypothetical protein
MEARLGRAVTATAPSGWKRSWRAKGSRSWIRFGEDHEQMIKLWTVYVCITLGMLGLLVLLRVDGLASRWVILSGCISLGVTTLSFQRAVRSQTPEATPRKIFEWSSGICFIILALAHFVIGRIGH